jgi:3-methylcrotonyl-CoA carboxylase alpha subunit
LRGFRLNASDKPKERLDVEGEPREFAFRPTKSGERFEHGFVDVHHHGDQFVQIEGDLIRLSWPRADAGGQASAADGAIIAPMPGKVIAVDVAEGQAVTAGQRLMVLEAMKMEHALTAPFDGMVEGLTVTAGGQVQVEAVLCRVVPAAE